MKTALQLISLFLVFFVKQALADVNSQALQPADFKITPSPPFTSPQKAAGLLQEMNRPWCVVKANEFCMLIAPRMQRREGMEDPRSGVWESINSPGNLAPVPDGVATPNDPRFRPFMCGRVASTVSVISFASAAILCALFRRRNWLKHSSSTQM